MKIYALSEQGGRGKTTTLKLLIVKLFERFGLTEDNIVSKETIKIEELKKEIDREKKSHRATVDHCIAVKIGNNIVGINTQGDNVACIERTFDLIKECHCNLVFCACRSKCKTVNMLKDFAENGNDLILMSKTSIIEVEAQRKHRELVHELNDVQAEILLKRVP